MYFAIWLKINVVSLFCLQSRPGIWRNSDRQPPPPSKGVSLPFWVIHLVSFIMNGSKIMQVGLFEGYSLGEHESTLKCRMGPLWGSHRVPEGPQKRSKWSKIEKSQNFCISYQTNCWNIDLRQSKYQKWSDWLSTLLGSQENLLRSQNTTCINLQID